MPNRIVRDGILTSERVAALDWPAEVFYRRLLSVVDDYGRYYAHPKLLRAACYPLQLDKVSDADIGKWTRCAEEAGLVSVYRAEDRKRYLVVLDFNQRIQGRSKFPEPPTAEENGSPPRSTVNHGDPPCTTVNHRLDEDEDGVVVEDEGGRARTSADPPETAPSAPLVASPAIPFFPNDGSEYQISAVQFAEFQRLYPAVDVLDQTRQMRAWSIANTKLRKTRRGALRFVNTWLASHQNGAGGRHGQPAKPQPLSASQRAEIELRDYVQHAGGAPGLRLGPHD